MTGDPKTSIGRDNERPQNIDHVTNAITLYAIVKWSETFETHDTRKRMRLGWFQCPSGIDSHGLLELTALGNRGLVAFAVFVLLCQWTATLPKGVRGKLCRSDGTPMTVEQIARQIRLDVDTVRDALELLSSQQIRWIEVKGSYAGHLPVACRLPAGHLPQGKGEGKGKGEGQGQGEGAGEASADAENDNNEAFKSDSSKLKPKRKTFEPPTVTEVQGYITERRCSVNAEKFVSYYEAVGWKVGKNPMKDWKAAVRTWESNDSSGRFSSSAATTSSGVLRKSSYTPAPPMTDAEAGVPF